MANQSFGDAGRVTLRRILADIDRGLALLPAEAASGSSALRASVAELVATLALGPAPETRECPKCKQVGFRGATRCINCWATLAPLPPGEQVQP